MKWEAIQKNHLLAAGIRISSENALRLARQIPDGKWGLEEVQMLRTLITEKLT
jgi:hypothetical protein